MTNFYIGDKVRVINRNAYYGGIPVFGFHGFVRPKVFGFPVGLDVVVQLTHDQNGNPLGDYFKPTGLFAESAIEIVKDGWYRKYNITKVDGSRVDPHADYFVLRIDNDKHAFKALHTYAESVREDNPVLYNDMIERINRYLHAGTNLD